MPPTSPSSPKSPTRPQKTPLDFLLPYQRQFATSPARYKIARWSRQTGKSFCTAEEAVRDCQINPTPQDWVCLSAGERQAQEWLAKAKQWAACYQIWASGTKFEKLAEHTSNASEIIFSRGSRIIALPANPSTSRGYSANLVLDEFAFHERPSEIWAAIYPSITNPLKGEKKLRIISTPNGKLNKFYELWTAENNWEKSTITIHDAIRGGLKIDVEELKKGVGDNDIWNQEYLCEFGDSSSVLLPVDLIEQAEILNVPDIPNSANRYLGIDIGRTHDKTVIVLLAEVGDVWKVEDVLELSETPFAAQAEAIGKFLEHPRLVAGCIDATGIGAGLSETLSEKYGGILEAVNINQPIKNELCQSLRRVFEDQKISIPTGFKDDLNSLEKRVSIGGTITYRAIRNKDGHSDFASALSLAIRATQSGGEVVMPFSF